jgi:hypothetical protein
MNALTSGLIGWIVNKIFMGWIERQNKRDIWIAIIGMLEKIGSVTLFCYYLQGKALHYLHLSTGLKKQ